MQGELAMKNQIIADLEHLASMRKNSSQHSDPTLIEVHKKHMADVTASHSAEVAASRQD
jgi:hypothetical protein